MNNNEHDGLDDATRIVGDAWLLYLDLCMFADTNNVLCIYFGLDYDHASRTCQKCHPAVSDFCQNTITVRQQLCEERDNIIDYHGCPDYGQQIANPEALEVKYWWAPLCYNLCFKARELNRARHRRRAHGSEYLVDEYLPEIEIRTIPEEAPVRKSTDIEIKKKGRRMFGFGDKQ